MCGLLDLPGLPVYLHRTEHDWVTTGSVAPVGGVRDSLEGRTTIDYELDGPPVLTFTRSHDLFGDGSVVLVDLAGHTPAVSVCCCTPRPAPCGSQATPPGIRTKSKTSARSRATQEDSPMKTEPRLSGSASASRHQGPREGGTHGRSRRRKEVARKRD